MMMMVNNSHVVMVNFFKFLAHTVQMMPQKSLSRNRVVDSQERKFQIFIQQNNPIQPLKDTLSCYFNHVKPTLFPSDSSLPLNNRRLSFCPL